MNKITRTALNSDAVQRFYQRKLTEKTFNLKKSASKDNQTGSGFLFDVIGGVAENVGKVISASRNLAASRKRKRNRIIQRNKNKSMNTKAPTKKITRTQTGKGKGRALKRQTRQKRQRRPTRVSL